LALLAVAVAAVAVAADERGAGGRHQKLKPINSDF
jgi:hypothetical protein